MGTVYGIYTCSFAGAVMEPWTSVNVIAGEGIEGDRYALGKGAYSNAKPVVPRHITFIEQEAVNAVNEGLDIPYTVSDTRRNIITRGIDLDSLVGKYFLVGRNVLIRGVEPADPCHRPDALLKRKPAQFKKAFLNRGGLRGEVIRGGIIKIGDSFTF